MKLTTNYSLKKPEGSDVVNIDDFNYNADIIDNAIQEIKNTSSTNKTNISSLQTKVNNGQNHKLTADNGISFELSSADLNTVTKTGNYVGNKWVNGPSTSYAIVEVTQGTSGMVKQVFTETTSTNQYMRIYRSSAWSEWREL